MRLACPCCDIKYVVPKSEIPNGMARIICPHCGYSWRKLFQHDIASKYLGKMSQDDSFRSEEPLKRSQYSPETLRVLREEAALETSLRSL